MKENMTREEKIEALSLALVAGAHSAFIRPVILQKIKTKYGEPAKISRLPLSSVVNGANSKHLVIAELCNHFSCNPTDIAYALKHVEDKGLACIDSVGISCQDLKAVQDHLEMVLLKRGAGTNAAIDSSAKIYVRDIKCPKPTTKSSKPVVTPDWLLSLGGDIQEVTDAIEEGDEDGAVEEMVEVE